MRKHTMLLTKVCFDVRRDYHWHIVKKWSEVFYHFICNWTSEVTKFNSCSIMKRSQLSGNSCWNKPSLKQKERPQQLTVSTLTTDCAFHNLYVFIKDARDVFLPMSRKSSQSIFPTIITIKLNIYLQSQRNLCLLAVWQFCQIGNSFCQLFDLP